MKRFLIVLAAFLTFPTPLFCVSLENRFLKADVDDESGRIFLSAAGLEADTDEARGRGLLFYDRPPSSFTALVFASGPTVFGNTEGRFTSRPHSEGDEIVCEWVTDQIQTTQAVSFIERRGSGRRDGVLIRYVIRNLSGREVPAGICVVFDTVLSEKSPAHFLLSDGRSVSGPLELNGVGMPDFWSTDGGGGACLMGVLRGSSVTVPDRALFANYRFIREKLFPPPLEAKAAQRAGFSRGAFSHGAFSHGEFSIDDSAVALVFKPVPLAADREYRIVIGLCGEGEFGPAPEGIAPAPRAEKHDGGAGAPARAPAPIAVPGPPAAPKMETGAVETPSETRPSAKGNFTEGELESLERIDELLEDIDELLEGRDRRLKDERVRDARRGSGQPGELPEPLDTKEINKLNERLREIEKTEGE